MEPVVPENIQSVVVFCGSSHGLRPEYEKAADDLGTLLAKNGYQVIYGGGHLGLMGAFAAAVSRNGEKLTAIIPTHFAHDIDHGNTSVDNRMCDDMFSRKKLMLENTEASIALAGGLGTCDEIFEHLVDQQISPMKQGLHIVKPLIVVNTLGFFDHLLKQIDHMVQEGFLKAGHLACLIVVDTPEQVLPALREWKKAHHTPFRPPSTSPTPRAL